ncbi:tyrosine-protein phosphatase [Kitasatospora sp. NPDC059648]|uniref:tyrosine-protein phosphatase n=1 Tax=Kitasatospora sp. NPDC059648 TaxID=3346894 RepID=UPI0036AD37C4
MERIISFTHLRNVRDLGGLVTTDGQAIRPGLVYRSDSLHKLAGAHAAEDRERYAKLGVRTVIDLRHGWEIDQQGRAPLDTAPAWHHLSIEHRSYDQYHQSFEDVARFFADRYVETAEDGREEIRAVLELVADPQSAPVLYHCKGGKDRTGIVTALILSLLGVAEADIVADYALTEAVRPVLLAEWDAAGGKPLPPGTGAFRAPARAMELFLTALARDYGSVSGYVASTGADPEDLARRLRALYLVREF